jgi:predicted AlkP superfamily phosphohydrolase/phosphomutase
MLFKKLSTFGGTYPHTYPLLPTSITLYSTFLTPTKQKTKIPVDKLFLPLTRSQALVKIPLDLFRKKGAKSNE